MYIFKKICFKITILYPKIETDASSRMGTRRTTNQRVGRHDARHPQDRPRPGSRMAVRPVPLFLRITRGNALQVDRDHHTREKPLATLVLRSARPILL